MTFPVALLKFPLNLLLLIIWAALLIMLWEKKRKCGFIRIMLSPAATYWAIGLFLIFSLIIGITGQRSLVKTWPFVIFLLYFQTVLAFVILRGWRQPTATGARLGPLRWRFLFLHVGLLTAIASPFWGAPDSETLLVRSYKDTPVTEAYAEDGKIRWLDYSLVLNGFVVTYGDDGMPSDYRADITVDGKQVELRVNHPYSIKPGVDLYLSGYDTAYEEFCMLQIVREPWRYGAIVGIIMMLTGAFMLFVGGPRRRNNELD